MNEMLQAMLSNTCPAQVKGDKRLFVYDLHCNEMWIIAQVHDHTFTILAWRLAGIVEDNVKWDWFDANA